MAASKGIVSQSQLKLLHPLEFNSWLSMKARCLYGSRERYIGRGITVCLEWRESFLQFLKDMGPRPSEQHSIERVDNESGYSKINCRWATATEQANNRSTTVSISAFGEMKTQHEWANDPRANVTENSIKRRIKNGETPEDAIVKKDRKRRVSITAFGETKNECDWLRDSRMKVPQSTFRARIKKGMSAEIAMSEPEKFFVMITAFGETKKQSDWAKDSRLAVSETMLSRRIRNGMSPEEAITRPGRTKRD